MTRIPVFDMMKGIAILFMIIGHCQIPDSLHRIIYLFHLPLFFIVSGYFYKNNSLKPQLVKDLKRLVVPYFLCAFVVGIKYGIDAFRLHDFSKIPDFCLAVIWGSCPIQIEDFSLPDIGPIWFLLALFWCRQIFNWIMTYKSGPIFVISIALFSTLLSQFVIFPWSILQGMSGMLFYLMGFLFAHHQNSRHTLLPLSVLIIPIAYFYGAIDMHTGLYPNFTMNVLGALAASYLLYVFLDFISQIHFLRSSMSWLGEWSLLILGVHYIEFMLINWNAKISFWMETCEEPVVWVIGIRILSIIASVFFLSRISFIKQIFVGGAKTK